MTQIKNDIKGLSDIKQMVDTFYGKIRQDDKLADIFNNVIQNRWPQHLEKMYRFWQTVLLEEHTYFGSPFIPHAKLPVDANHFERWLQLFNETVDTLFEGEKANRAKWQGQRMAEMFLSKINYYNNNSAIPLL
ncbi:MAG: group III truncated hemoglobin [Sphingobacteriales bacterium]|jgi:hemoglobin|nr:group III truncated hemoglobin [Sphingobacteriales bacterium]MBP9140725.1 group III truncated hemoglobin [Chitinophagales bacterium]MDA0197973.1 group III truncated hemoglobin [Bacteroidota bacterium]MBK6890522.1 group III truncated hemoglobin [Sphingobacteriales bacterium]MBK7526426.1 group III truncated hemoglobin [Sphingobacteriales bacterium]